MQNRFLIDIHYCATVEHYLTRFTVYLTVLTISAIRMLYIKTKLSEYSLSLSQEASRTRVRSAWGKFNELAPVLTKRGVSLKLKGKIYDACVQRVLVYGSETWAIKAEDLARLRRAERMMVRRMCGVSLKDRKRSDELLNRLGIECVENKIQRGRLRWFGHVERKEENNWVKKCTRMNVIGVVDRGAPRKTWRSCVKRDMKAMGIKEEMAQDRCAWRNIAGGPTRASADA